MPLQAWAIIVAFAAATLGVAAGQPSPVHVVCTAMFALAAYLFGKSARRASRSITRTTDLASRDSI